MSINTTLNTHEILGDDDRKSVLSMPDSELIRFYHFSALSRWGDGSGWGDDRVRFSDNEKIKKENYLTY